MLFRLSLTLFLSLPNIHAEAISPRGSADVMTIEYAPHKVLYDVDHGSLERLSNILDRVSYLNELYKADPFES